LLRIRIVKQPPVADIDGIRFDRFETGQEYEVGNCVGAVLLAEGWAEPVALDAAAVPVRSFNDDLFARRSQQGQQLPNLVRNLYRSQPRKPAMKTAVPDRASAADFQRKRLRTRHR
jgi:hypothetical protein